MLTHFVTNRPMLLVVTGLPCTGKTTLGKYLASQLKLPFIHKDGIKETLFDLLGLGGSRLVEKARRCHL